MNGSTDFDGQKFYRTVSLRWVQQSFPLECGSIGSKVIWELLKPKIGIQPENTCEPWDFAFPGRNRLRHVVTIVPKGSNQCWCSTQSLQYYCKILQNTAKAVQNFSVCTAKIGLIYFCKLVFDSKLVIFFCERTSFPQIGVVTTSNFNNFRTFEKFVNFRLENKLKWWNQPINFIQNIHIKV